MPSLVAELAVKAPGICLELVAWSDEAFRQLEKNDLDLILWVDKAPPGLKYDALFREKFVCVVRENHPLSAKPLTLKRYLQYPHIVISILKNQQTVITQSLEEKKLERRILAKVPYFNAGVWFLENTDAILTIGKRLADKLAINGPFRVLLPPVEIKNYTYIQVWHPRSEGDPLLKWVRSELKHLTTKR